MVAWRLSVPLNAQLRIPGVPCDDIDCFTCTDCACESGLGTAGTLPCTIPVAKAVGVSSEADEVLAAFTCGATESAVTPKLVFASAAVPMKKDVRVTRRKISCPLPIETESCCAGGASSVNAN